MPVNKNLAVADFDEIKSAFKDFLKENPKFTDYDFDGSALSVILDTLAYNTHHNAMYANLALNEMFLDSAVTRSGVVSRTRELGYVPRSVRASKAGVNVIATNVPTALQTRTLTLDRGTRFIGTDETGGNEFTYVVTNPVTVSISNNAYVFENVPIHEGEYRTWRFDVDSTNERKIFELPHDDIDTSTIRVRVQTSSSDGTTRIVEYADTVYKLDGLSSVYFLQENWRGRWEIVFGDSVIGMPVVNGNIILVDYIVTNKAAANGIRSFTLIDNIGQLAAQSFVITTVSSSVGGDERESISSIKNNAPLARAAQRRCVTAIDVQSKLYNETSLFSSINVWGGEDNDPPIYGKVFISAKPKGGYYMSNALKQQLTKTILDPNMVVSIQPEFVDPDYIWISLVNNVKFNPYRTTSDVGTMQTSINQLITQYFSNEVELFGRPFVFSKLAQFIHTQEPSVVSFASEIRMLKRFWVIPFTFQQVVLKFSNAIHPYTFRSQPFAKTILGVVRNCYLIDTPNVEGEASYTGGGEIHLVDYDNDQIIFKSIGKIEYTTGRVNIKDFKIDALLFDTGLDLKFSAEPQDQTIDVKRNQLIVIDQLPTGSQKNFFVGMASNVEELYQ